MNQNHKNKLGELLLKLRGYKSLRDIAEQTNGKLSFGHLGLLEKGINPSTGKPVKPSVKALKALSEVYNYPYEELMRLADYINEPTVEDLVKRYTMLTEEEKERFKIMIERA